MERIKSALVLAPHPDDGEFSSGGTIKKLSSEGVQIWYAAFSPCTISVPDGFEKDVLFVELIEAVTVLGIDKSNVITYDFPVRKLSEHRQEILENMVELKKQINPDLVFLPSSKDIHQDHQIIHNEGVRAFKNTRILGYELPWNNLETANNFFVKLSEEELNAKYAAIEAYKSQEFRKYHSKELFISLARARGVQINTEYAEGFEVIRWMI